MSTHTNNMLRVAPATCPLKATRPACRAVLRPSVASRRVTVWADAPGKDGEKHSLVSVWEDHELQEGETAQLKVPPKPSDEKHTLVSVWEEHELKEAEEADKKKKESSLLNHPTGKQQVASSYDSM